VSLRRAPPDPERQQRGHEHLRALHFHELAAAAALDRHAAHEAVAHCTAALDALAHTPEDRERDRRELGLVVARAVNAFK